MKTKNKNFINFASLLDRFIDEHPDISQEMHVSEQRQFSMMHENICRDLECLLNTRCAELQWPGTWQALERSLVNYGMSDISVKKLDTILMREKFCSDLAYTIRCFDTRFKEIQVQLLQTEPIGDRILRLRIEALLLLEPASEWLILDSIVDPSSNSFQISQSMHT